MQWEYNFLTFINGIMSSEWMDSVMLFITRLSDHGEIWALIGIILLMKKSTRKVGIGVFVVLVTGYLVGNLFLKQVIARPRPFDVYPIELILAPPTDYSFPSGHTLASFESAVFVWLKMRKFGTILLVLASLIAFSRLYLMVHYPTDVLCGILLAIVVAYFADYVVNRDWRGLSTRK